MRHIHPEGEIKGGVEGRASVLLFFFVVFFHSKGRNKLIWLSIQNTALILHALQLALSLCETQFRGFDCSCWAEHQIMELSERLYNS